MDKSIQKQVKNLIEIIGCEPYTSTHKLSLLFGVKHKSLRRLVNKYRKEFEDFEQKSVKTRVLTVISSDRKSTPKKAKIGPPEVEYLLSESQSMYLILLSKNNPTVSKFKAYVAQSFFKQRGILNSLLIKKQNTEWLERRASGIVDRREATDAIKELIGYAFENGSKNADKYYVLFSKMEMTILFGVDLLECKYPNLRELLSGSQIASLENADRIIARAIREGIGGQFFYKDIYKMAKGRVENFAELIGKPPILAIEQDPQLVLA